MPVHPNKYLTNEESWKLFSKISQFLQSYVTFREHGYTLYHIQVCDAFSLRRQNLKMPHWQYREIGFGYEFQSVSRLASFFLSVLGIHSLRLSLTTSWKMNKHISDTSSAILPRNFFLCCVARCGVRSDSRLEVDTVYGCGGLRNSSTLYSSEPSVCSLM